MMEFYSCRVYDFKMSKEFSSLSITENFDVKLTCYFNMLFSAVYVVVPLIERPVLPLPGHLQLFFLHREVYCVSFYQFFSSPDIRHTFCYADWLYVYPIVSRGKLNSGVPHSVTFVHLSGHVRLWRALICSNKISVKSGQSHEVFHGTHKFYERCNAVHIFKYRMSCENVVYNCISALQNAC